MNENITAEVLNHHLTAFGDNDLKEILKDYTEESEIFTPLGPVNGLSAIERFFSDYFKAIPTGSAFELKQLTVRQNVGYVAWSSESDKLHIPLGTDTFVM